ncbi:MAG: hypothetical protein WCG27_10945 [Pseudomonadota bacterium]
MRSNITILWIFIAFVLHNFMYSEKAFSNCVHLLNSSVSGSSVYLRYRIGERVVRHSFTQTDRGIMQWMWGEPGGVRFFSPDSLNLDWMVGKTAFDAGAGKGRAVKEWRQLGYNVEGAEISYLTSGRPPEGIMCVFRC